MLYRSIAMPRCVHLRVRQEVGGWIDETIWVRSTSYRPIWCPAAIAASTHPSDSTRPMCCEPTPRSSCACHIEHGTLPEWKRPGLGADTLCTARLIGCSLRPPIGRHSVPGEARLLPGLTVPGRVRRTRALHRGQASGHGGAADACTSSHEELDTHHKCLGTHTQSTPRAGEGLPAGAARLGRAALQNHLFELQDAVVVRMLYVGMQVCMLNCGKASHITDKKRRETQQSYLIVSYNSYLPVPCGELPAANRRGRDVPGGTIPVHWYAGRHRQLSATA